MGRAGGSCKGENSPPRINLAAGPAMPGANGARQTQVQNAGGKQDRGGVSRRRPAAGRSVYSASFAGKAFSIA
ncbi:hypothetical protein GCM10011345_25870 [Gemmobacter megaterium]|nr:hypothetical protein GCM10011345_25870 [Gemmobacter megaterium]